MFEDFYPNNLQRKPMDDPFYSNNFHPYTYSPPPRRPPSQPPQQPRPRKVVSIPVHHVESSAKRSESATKIQKTFRGFRVRKTVKKILELKREVDDVEKKLFEGETMAVIRRNSLERLKVNEALMAVLFKLDSIRGFDCGVREFRKAVITKAIMLQEIVDAAIDDEKGEIDMNVDKLTENFDDSSRISEKIDGESETLGENVDRFDDSSKMQVEEKISNEISTETLGGDEKIRNEIGTETLGEDEQICNDISTETLGEDAKICSEIGTETLGEDVGDNEMEVFDDSSKMQVEYSEEINSEKIRNEISCKEEKAIADDNGDESWECIGDEINDHKSSDFVEVPINGGVESWEGNRNRDKKDWYVRRENRCCCGGDGGDEKEKKDKLLEKMAEDNSRLMKMVADLCEKNAVQTQLICSLSNRVDHLEKAMNDRLRKKKKKCNANL